MDKEDVKNLLQIIFLIIVIIIAIVVGISVNILGVLRDIKILSM